MKIHLVSGGCGFVGRNMVKRLYETTNDTILFIDNLLVGTHPTTWLDAEKVGDNEDIEVFGKDERLLFLKEDFRRLLTYMIYLLTQNFSIGLLDINQKEYYIQVQVQLIQ